MSTNKILPLSLFVFVCFFWRASAQEGAVLSAGFDPVLGAIISWDGKAGAQYEVLRSATNLQFANFSLSPLGINPLENNRPAAFRDEVLFYQDPEGFALGDRVYYRVRGVDAGTITLFLLATVGTIETDSGQQPPANSHLQIIWSADAVASPLDPFAPFVPTDEEFVLVEQPMNDLDGAVDLFLLEGNNDHSGIYTGGYLYLRIFNVDFGSGNTPTLYGQSTEVFGPMRVANIDPASVNQVKPSPFTISIPIQP